MESYAEVIDDMPRSRKPIALDEMDNMFEANGPPNIEEAPPAYTDMSQGPYTDVGQMPYRVEQNYSAYTPTYGSSSYGAAC